MKRRYYVHIAAELNQLINSSTDSDIALIDNIIAILIPVFKEDNPLFSEEKFVNACYKKQ